MNKDPHAVKMTQYEANEVYERAEFDVGVRFSKATRNIIVPIYFLPIFPLGIFFAIIFNIVDYWIEKYIVFNRSSCKNVLGRKTVLWHDQVKKAYLIIYVFGIITAELMVYNSNFKICT